MKGYTTPSGYVGYIPKLNKWIVFPTEQEYIEFMNEVCENIERKVLYGEEAT